MPERRARDGADRVGEQRLPRPRQRAVPHQPRLLADADERADRVEQREKEEHEARPAIMPGASAPAMSSCRNVGASDGGGLAIP